MKARLIAVLAMAVTAAVLNTGCASSGSTLGEGAKATDGVMESARLLREGQQDVEQVVVSLDALQSMQGGTIPELFESFENSVDAMDKTANRIGATNRKMKDNAANYFETWNEEIASIANESIRSSSEDRQAKLKKGMDKLKKKFDGLTEDYDGFLANLTDIRTALKLDLNAEGIKAVSKPITKAKKQAKAIEKSAGEVADTYEELGVRMSALDPEG